MPNWKFGERSEKELATADPRLVNVLREALKTSPIDFGIVQGARTIELQRHYFLAGKSKVDPNAYPTKAKLYASAKHVVGPGMPFSRAVDIIVAGSKPYDVPKLLTAVKHILATAKKMGVPMRSGGDWDQDGEYLTDQGFDDLPHLELV